MYHQIAAHQVYSFALNSMMWDSVPATTHFEETWKVLAKCMSIHTVTILAKRTECPSRLHYQMYCIWECAGSMSILLERPLYTLTKVYCIYVIYCILPGLGVLAVTSNFRSPVSRVNPIVMVMPAGGLGCQFPAQFEQPANSKRFC